MNCLIHDRKKGRIRIKPMLLRARCLNHGRAEGQSLAVWIKVSIHTVSFSIS